MDLEWKEDLALYAMIWFGVNVFFDRPVVQLRARHHLAIRSRHVCRN